MANVKSTLFLLCFECDWMEKRLNDEHFDRFYSEEKKKTRKQEQIPIHIKINDNFQAVIDLQHDIFHRLTTYLAQNLYDLKRFRTNMRQKPNQFK